MAHEEKSIEMRVAELEDKLQAVRITEEELQTYQKVARAAGQALMPGAGCYATPACQCVVCQPAAMCVVCTPYYMPAACSVQQCTIMPCQMGYPAGACSVQQCTISPCRTGYGGQVPGMGAGGFGGFGG